MQDGVRPINSTEIISVPWLIDFSEASIPVNSLMSQDNLITGVQVCWNKRTQQNSKHTKISMGNLRLLKINILSDMAYIKSWKLGTPCAGGLVMFLCQPSIYLRTFEYSSEHFDSVLRPLIYYFYDWMYNLHRLYYVHIYNYENSPRTHKSTMYIFATANPLFRC